MKPFDNPVLMKLLMAFPRLLLVLITLAALAVILPLLLIVSSFRLPYRVFLRLYGRSWFYR